VIALKFIAAGMIVIAILCIGLAIEQAISYHSEDGGTD
jgi:hypothetical protein